MKIPKTRIVLIRDGLDKTWYVPEVKLYFIWWALTHYDVTEGAWLENHPATIPHVYDEDIDASTKWSPQPQIPFNAKGFIKSKSEEGAERAIKDYIDIYVAKEKNRLNKKLSSKIRQVGVVERSNPTDPK